MSSPKKSQPIEFVIACILFPALFSATYAMTVEVELLQRESASLRLDLRDISEESITLIERRGSATIERQLKREQVRYIHMLQTPFYGSEGESVGFQGNDQMIHHWEQLWNEWRPAAVCGWISPQWKASWWEVIQIFQAQRGSLDTLLFAETFVEWFEASDYYKDKLYRLLAECLIEMDQLSEALPYLETIIAKAYPKPEPDLYELIYGIHINRGALKESLNAWLDACVLTGKCNENLLNMLLDQWDSRPGWRDLEKPKPVIIYGNESTKHDDPA